MKKTKYSDLNIRPSKILLNEKSHPEKRLSFFNNNNSTMERIEQIFGCPVKYKTPLKLVNIGLFCLY